MFKIDIGHRNALAVPLADEMISSLKIFIDSILRCLENEKRGIVDLEESVII